MRATPSHPQGFPHLMLRFSKRLALPLAAAAPVVAQHAFTWKPAPYTSPTNTPLRSSVWLGPRLRQPSWCMDLDDPVPGRVSQTQPDSPAPLSPPPLPPPLAPPPALPGLPAQPLPSDERIYTLTKDAMANVDVNTVTPAICVVLWRGRADLLGMASTTRKT